MFRISLIEELDETKYIIHRLFSVSFVIQTEYMIIILSTFIRPFD